MESTCDKLIVKTPLFLEACLWLQTSEQTGNILSSIWYSFYQHNQLFNLQTFLMQRELANASKTEQIMREDSPEIALLQFNLRTFGAVWLESILSVPMRKIISRKTSMEIDPSKFENCDKETLQENSKALLQCASYILDMFSPENVKDIPSEIIYSCKIIHQETSKKFPQSKYHALAGYLFLRFICPAISAPEKYNIVKKSFVPRDARRKLILVTKVIQSVVNNSPNNNESYMSVVNDFVADRAKNLNLFFDAILEAKIEKPVSPGGRLWRHKSKIDFGSLPIDNLAFHQNNLLQCISISSPNLEEFFQSYKGPHVDSLETTREKCRKLVEQNPQQDLLSPDRLTKSPKKPSNARIFRRRFSLPFLPYPRNTM